MGFTKNGVNRTKRRYRKQGFLNKVRVLVFDDDAANCEILRAALLQQSGALISVTQSVETALQMHRRTPYHVVIAGLQPGSWTGYELLKAIRETDVEYRGFTPALAVSGFSSPEDEQRAIDAGFNAYISRPFGASDITDAIIQVLHDSDNLAA